MGSYTNQGVMKYYQFTYRESLNSIWENLSGVGNPLISKHPQIFRKTLLHLISIL